MSAFSHFHNYMSIGTHFSLSGRERLPLGSLDLKRSSGPVASGLQLCCTELRNLSDNKKKKGKKKNGRCLNKHSCYPSHNGENCPKTMCTRNKHERLQFARSRLTILGYSYLAGDAGTLRKAQREGMHSAGAGGRKLSSSHLSANSDILPLPCAS